MTTPIVSSPLADAEFAALIAGGAAQMAIDLDPGQVDRLVAYLRLIERWNVVYNLTAVRSVHAMATQHVVDSLAAIPTLRHLLQRNGGRRILDVGSGAGLPGVVLAIVERETKVVCVDSVGKKSAFVAQVAGTLGLANLSAVHARVEAMQPPPAFEVIVSRAFSSLANLVSLTRHLLCPDGWWLAMKGKVPQQEIADTASMGVHFEVRALNVPGLAAERCLLLGRPMLESERQL